jgi:hypothetical protein
VRSATAAMATRWLAMVFDLVSNGEGLGLGGLVVVVWEGDGGGGGRGGSE